MVTRIPPHSRSGNSRPRAGSIVAAVLLGLLVAPVVTRGQDNSTKARALVKSAIQMTDSDQAVKLLWQATDLDPTLEDPYVYLGVYYNSRSDFANMIKVYEKLVKYRPTEVSAYLNIGEAYMSYTPPRSQDALTYFKKAYELDSKNPWTALRIGEILATNGDRDGAVKYLKQALGSSKNPTASREAEKVLRQMGAL
jgi:tetratricopeptide (TPR) repeat protein